MNSGTTFPDPVAAHYALLAILAALRHRARTGEGQHIDVSMQEATLSLVGDAALEHALTGRVRPRMGNRHPSYAPHGIYPAAEPDRWVALAAEDEAQWRALCALARRGWERDVRFTSMASRKSHEDALDAAIEAWTATQPRDALVAALRSAGVIAAPVLEPGELAEDAALLARGANVEVEHPEAGRWPHVAIPWRLSATPARVTRAAPRIGEHSREVFARLLGMGDTEYAALEAANVTGEGPPA